MHEYTVVDVYGYMNDRPISSEAESKGSLSDSKAASESAGCHLLDPIFNGTDDSCLLKPIYNDFRGRTNVVIPRHNRFTAKLLYH